MRAALLLCLLACAAERDSRLDDPEPAPAPSKDPTLKRDPACNWVCAREGKCFTKIGRLGERTGCFTYLQEDCEASELCGSSGKCTLIKDSGCQVGGADDCRKSSDCTRSGACNPEPHSCESTDFGCIRERRCIAKSCDCEWSRGCRQPLGDNPPRCRLYHAMCVEGSGDATCGGVPP